MNTEEFWARVDKRDPDECWPWLGNRNGGSGPPRAGRIHFEGRRQYAYRVAWELTTGQTISVGLVGRHSCDNPLCVNPGHIEPGTQAENMADAARRKRARNSPRYGLDHHAAKLDADAIRAIVEDYMSGNERQDDVAARHGISQSTLSRWCRGELRPDAGLPERDFAKLRPCGTHAAYVRHRRRGEKPCEACVIAERAHCAVARARRNAAKSQWAAVA